MNRMFSKVFVVALAASMFLLVGSVTAVPAYAQDENISVDPDLTLDLNFDVVPEGGAVVNEVEGETSNAAFHEGATDGVSAGSIDQADGINSLASQNASQKDK